jgi:menaquinol-cytochrome c reductase iron-sulfur subunit
MSSKDPKTNEPENIGRRNFLVGMIVFLGGLIGLALGGSGLTYFLSPGWKGKKENWVEVGLESDLPEGQPVKREFVQRIKDGWATTENQGTVWLLKNQGQLAAYSPHCTHLGCPYRWDSDKNSFVCPCHGGVFDKFGKVLSGPPPRGLDRYQVKVNQGVINILPEEA